MPQPIERFHYGQGEVLAARWSGDTPPAANAWKKLWDVSALSVALARESFTHKESRSGKKMEVRDISNGESGTVKATIAAINTHNLALLLSSSVVDITVGSVSAEALPTGIAAGDVILFDHVGISDLVVTDSAGTPVTIDAAHYELAAAYGQLTILSLPAAPTPTQPLKVSYDYAAARAVGILAASSPAKIALRYNGINLAENGAPVIVDLWKLQVGVLSEMALINNDTSVANLPFEAKLLADLTRPDGDLGYFGQMRYLDTDG